MGGLEGLGALFRSRREELGLSLHEVSRRAEQLGVQLSISQVRRIERGAMPRADHLVALCRVYGLPERQVHDVVLASGDRAVRVEALRETDPEKLLERGDELVGEGKMSRARARYLLARALAREAGDRVRELAATARLAWVDMYDGHYAAALFGFAAVVEAKDAAPEDREIARIRLLRLHVRMGWREHARALAPTVREIARDGSRSANARAGAWSAVAVYEGEYGDLEAAIGAWRTAMRLLARARKERERIRAGIGFLDFLLEREMASEAVRVARELERRSRKPGLRGVRADVVARLGRALVLAGRPKQAITWITEGGELAKDAGDLQEVVRALAWECRARAALGDRKAARDALQAARREAAGLAEIEADTARLLVSLEAQLAPEPPDDRGAMHLPAGEGAPGSRGYRRPGGAA